MNKEQKSDLIYKIILGISLAALIVGVFLPTRDFQKAFDLEFIENQIQIPAKITFKYFKPSFIVGSSLLIMITLGLVTWKSKNIYMIRTFLVMQIGLIATASLAMFMIIWGSNIAADYNKGIESGLSIEPSLIAMQEFKDMELIITITTIVGHFSAWMNLIWAITDTVLLNKYLKESVVEEHKSVWVKKEPKLELQELQEKIELEKIKKEEIAAAEEVTREIAKYKTLEAVKVAKLKNEQNALAEEVANEVARRKAVDIAEIKRLKKELSNLEDN